MLQQGSLGFAFDIGRPEICMRVVIVADYAIAEGGAPQVAIASAAGLADLGHQVTFVHGVGEQADALLEDHPNILRIGLGGQDIWKKPLLAAARDGIWNRRPLPKLAKILSNFDAADTVVHVHQWTKFFSPSLFASVTRAGLPLIVTLHDYFLNCPTGLKYRFDQKRPCDLRPLSLGCLAAPCDPRTSLHKAIRVLRSLAVRHALGGVNFTAIHVSDSGRRTIGAYLPPNVRQYVLENPIECGDPTPRKTGVGRKVVYCGRLTEEKGADLVAQAAKDVGLPSLFIGDGPLHDRVLAIDPDAEITGWVSKSEARARISEEALAVVAPSRWPETGPLVVGESMASGVPVIVSERAGAAGRVANELNGFVVAPTAAEIAGVLAKLREPEAAEKIGSAAYASFWAAPPNLRTHATGLEKIYRATLAGAG